MEVLAKVYDVIRFVRDDCPRSLENLKEDMKHAALMLRDLVTIQHYSTLTTGLDVRPISLSDLKRDMSKIFQRPPDAALVSELSLAMSAVTIAGGRLPEFLASQDTTKPAVFPLKIAGCEHAQLNGVYRYRDSLDGPSRVIH